MGAELHYTQRGADVTFHGPHQVKRGFGLVRERLLPSGFVYLLELRPMGWHLVSILIWATSSISCRVGFQIKKSRLCKKRYQMLPPDEVIHDQLITCFFKTFGYTNVIWKDGSFVSSDCRNNWWSCTILKLSFCILFGHAINKCCLSHVNNIKVLFM